MRRARRWHRLARFWHVAGDLDEAFRSGMRALSLAQGTESALATPAAEPVPVLLVAEILFTLGLIDRDRAAYASSRQHLDVAVELLATAPTSIHRDARLGHTLVALADAHRRSGRYEDVDVALSRVWRLLPATGRLPDSGSEPATTPTMDLDTVRSVSVEALTVEGIAAKERGAFDQAARCYAQIERLLDEWASTIHVVALHHNRAGLAHARGRYVEAESHARRAVGLRRTQPRANPVDLAQDLAVLAAALAGQHRHDEALALLNEAMSICEKARPPRSYEIAVHLHNLAAIHQTLGDHTSAEHLYRQALARKQTLLGDEHPEIALIANNLATLLHDQCRTTEAVHHYRRALSIVERTHSPSHPFATVIRANLDRLERRGRA
jgi:tetratricopeptide (TPR) repeat protein